MKLLKDPVWGMKELEQEFVGDVWDQYKNHDPERAWLNSLPPAPNYRGELRIAVDFVAIAPAPEHTRTLDPRPKPWVVVLTTKERLTPRGLSAYEEIKPVSAIEQLSIYQNSKLRFEDYEKAYQGSRELSNYVAQRCQLVGVDVLTPRTAECRRCKMEISSTGMGRYDSFTDKGHAILVRIAPLEPKDDIIHVCEHAS